VTPQLRRVGVTLNQIRLEELEEFVVIEEHIELCQLGFELELELGHHLEEVHGIVSVYYHVTGSG
jgi:hypothetical protein